MTLLLYAAITLLGLGSYILGIWQMLKGRYSPSTFSRVIWVLLSINSFAGVMLGESSRSSVFLAAILLLGNIAICIVSFWKGTRIFGKLEYFCLALLDAPLLILASAFLLIWLVPFRLIKKDRLIQKEKVWDFGLSSFFRSHIITLFDGSVFLLAMRQHN
jgi:hypothetical protein